MARGDRSRSTGSRSGTASASSRAATTRSATRSRTRRGASRDASTGRRPRTIWALKDVSFSVDAGRGARHHRPERRREVDAAQDPDADHDADERTGRDPGPRRQPARGRHRLPSRADRPREHLSQRRHPRHGPSRDHAEAARDRGLRRRRRSSSTRPSSATRAACTCGSRSPSPPISSPRSCSSTRCSRSATRSSSGDRLGRMEEFSQSGRTVLFVSHNMQTLARLCDRAILLQDGADRDGRAERGGRRALPPDRVRNAVASLLARPRDGAGRQARSAARGACRRRGRRARRTASTSGSRSASR